MRTSHKAAAAGTVGMMLISGAVVAGSTGAQATGGRQLTGTWAVTVDPDGAPPAFGSTIVYTATGSVMETTMNRPPSAISTGLGTWERLGEGKFAVTHRKYRWSPSGFAGTVVVHEVSEVSADGSSYTARATTTFFDPTGNPDSSMSTMSSTVTAQRL